MKTTLFMAISANGIIADKDGSEDFLSHEHWNTFSGLVKEYGNFIVGRKTYEAVQNWGEEYSFDDFADTEKIILSRGEHDFSDGYVCVSSPDEALEMLSQKGFDSALVIGGATINAAFAKENLIDEITLNIEPAIVGKGIPLFTEENFYLSLNLIGTNQVTNDIIQLRYEVQR